MQYSMSCDNLRIHHKTKKRLTRGAFFKLYQVLLGANILARNSVSILIE
jgi:hypothetical protein